VVGGCYLECGCTNLVWLVWV